MCKNVIAASVYNFEWSNNYRFWGCYFESGWPLDQTIAAYWNSSANNYKLTTTLNDIKKDYPDIWAPLYYVPTVIETNRTFATYNTTDPCEISSWYDSSYGPFFDYELKNNINNPSQQQSDSITFANEHFSPGQVDTAYITATGTTSNYLADSKTAAMQSSLKYCQINDNGEVIDRSDIMAVQYPILLNDGNDMTTEIINELNYLGVKNIVMFGGEEWLQQCYGFDSSFNVVRIGGRNTGVSTIDPWYTSTGRLDGTWNLAFDSKNENLLNPNEPTQPSGAITGVSSGGHKWWISTNDSNIVNNLSNIEDSLYKDNFFNKFNVYDSGSALFKLTHLAGGYGTTNDVATCSPVVTVAYQVSNNKYYYFTGYYLYNSVMGNTPYYYGVYDFTGYDHYLPNLTTSISVPGNMEANTVYNSTITVTNTDTKSVAKDFYVALLDNSSYIGKIHIDQLGPGQSQNITIPYNSSATLGQHTYTAIADYFNTVDESNENDNTSTAVGFVFNNLPPVAQFTITPGTQYAAGAFILNDASYDQDTDSMGSTLIEKWEYCSHGTNAWTVFTPTGGSTDSLGRSVNKSFVIPGATAEQAYDFRITVSDKGNPVSPSDSKSVTSSLQTVTITIPTAAFTVSSPVEINQEYTFTDQANSNISGIPLDSTKENWQYSLNGGSKVNCGNARPKSFSQPGAYTLYRTVTSQLTTSGAVTYPATTSPIYSGPTIATTQTITVYDNKPPVAQFTIAPGTQYAAGAFILNDTSYDQDTDSLGNTLSEKWEYCSHGTNAWTVFTPTGGSTDSLGRSVNKSFVIPGATAGQAYDFRITVSDKGNPVTPSDSKSVTSSLQTVTITIPTAAFTVPNMCMIGDTITYSDTSNSNISIVPLDNTKTLWQYYLNGTLYRNWSTTRIDTFNTIGTYTIYEKVTTQITTNGNVTYPITTSLPSAAQTLIVSDVSVIGQVNHTDLWNQNRINYNMEKTNTPDSPRDIATFFPGEDFILVANTTPGGNAQSVSVNINGTSFSTNLTQTSSNVWTGDLWDQSMCNWPNETVKFTFTATYPHGIIKTYYVNIKIDGEGGYWQQHREF